MIIDTSSKHVCPRQLWIYGDYASPHAPEKEHRLGALKSAGPSILTESVWIVIFETTEMRLFRETDE